MLDARLFTALPAEQRGRIADEFIAFARRRDGEPDVGKRTLSNREAFFRQLCERPKPKWEGEPISQEEFTAWHRGGRRLSEAPPLVGWLVRVARANEGEGWGVDYLLDRGGFDGLGRDGRLQPRDFADLEEVYHTRILHEIVRLFGIDFEMRIPPKPIQQSVKVLARLPRQASYMLLLAGELMGTVAFAHMARMGEHLLAEHSEIAARVTELMDEILVDEVGHVTFLLGSMRGWQLSTIRQLALAYAAWSRRSYTDDANDNAVMSRGIQNYSLDIMPQRVLLRAFVPAPYWPATCGPRPDGAA